MRILGRYAATDRVIVVLPDAKTERRTVARSFKELAGFSPRVQAVAKEPGKTLARLLGEGRPWAATPARCAVASAAAV